MEWQEEMGEKKKKKKRVGAEKSIQRGKRGGTNPREGWCWGGWRWMQKWTEAMNEVRLMKGLSVLQFLTPNGSRGFLLKRASLYYIPPRRSCKIPTRFLPFFFFFFFPCPNSSLFVLYSTNKLGLYSTCGLIQSSARRDNICLAPRRGAEIIIVMAFRAINTARQALFRRRREKVSSVVFCIRKGLNEIKNK